MKKHLTLITLFLILLAASSAAAADSLVTVNPVITYMCGDSFEITLPDMPATTSQITRGTSIQAEAAYGERLMMVRVIFRNLTPEVYRGLSADSFTLKGYVRDRSISYRPEIFQSYDYAYGSSGSAVTSASSLTMPPLRQEDILLVFRVNPILINWELHAEPKPIGETVYEYDNARYEPMMLQRCEGTFRFTSVRNAETGEIIYYNR